MGDGDDSAVSTAERISGPIVIEEAGCFYFYASATEAERALEAIDVRNGEYRAFGEDGRSLALEVYHAERRGVLFTTKVELVRLVDRPNDKGLSAEELRGYLARVGDSPAPELDVRELIARGLERFPERA